MSFPVPPVVPKRLSTFPTLWAFLFSRRRFADMATAHDLAIIVQPADQLARYKAGAWSSGTELEAMRQASLARLLRTRTQFWRSGLAIVGVFMLLVIMYSGLGRPLELVFPDDMGKVLAALGAIFATWGSVIQLTGVESWSGESADEKLRSMLFQTMFVLGGAFALIGVLW
ncbi:hypothetical protein [Acidovorax sp.]|uniref:hypothetical protein n=1 Tax=Acidovorax sp. TaxID=1872122 RepID=UPI00391F5199